MDAVDQLKLLFALAIAGAAAFSFLRPRGVLRAAG